MITSTPSSDIGPLFSAAASPEQEAVAEVSDKPAVSRSRPFPVSVRFTAEEKARLDKDSGHTAVSEYIRRCVLADDATDRAKQHRKKKRNASVDTVMAAKLLGVLGQSEMTEVLFALLLAAKAGELETLPDAADKLDTACNHIADMREMLILALNVKPKGKRL